MSQDATPDMIRWTFSVSRETRDEIATHLTDLGMDVVATAEGQFLVTWDEPDRDTDELASELWDIHGEPFDIIQEEFRRITHVLIHADDADGAEAA